jgi:hypothetical protein
MYNPASTLKAGPAAALSWSLFFFVLYGCESSAHNFSQYPGFEEYFSSNPPSNELPNPKDRQLLHRFQPRFMLPQGQPEPIDFYKDYIASGVLTDGHGGVINSSVTRPLLNSYRDNPDIVFIHEPGRESNGAVVYGRIDRETVSFSTDSVRILKPLTFLTYHIVFRHSGVPAGIAAWQEALLGLIFDLNDWHQLDHYTAVSLIIEEDIKGDTQPVAVMMQQHNYLRTYMIGEGIDLPDDGRVVIDIAKRSNELYPHSPGPNRHRAVNMPDPEGMRFLLTGDSSSLLAGFDVTDGAEEVLYTLEFLPHDDAFYTFKGFLGKRRWLKGRDAPPGADYNTLPVLKPLPMQLFSGYWRENHPADIARLNRTILKNADYQGFAELQGAEFYKNWKQQ